MWVEKLSLRDFVWKYNYDLPDIICFMYLQWLCIEIYDSIKGENMEDKKEINGHSVSEVFGKMAKRYY